MRSTGGSSSLEHWPRSDPMTLGGRGRRERLADVLLELLEKLRLRLVADDALRLAAVLEQDHGRDRADAEPTRRDRIRVDVELRDLELVVLGGDLLEDGADHPAGAAPGRPEVDEHRLVGLQDLLFEIRITDLGRLPQFKL